MKYIITERQFKKISDLVLKEQDVPQTNPLPLSGVTINGVKYKSPKIKTQIDVDALTAKVEDELSKIVDYGRMKGNTAMRPFTQDKTNFGVKLISSIPEFLRVNAILGNPKAIDFATLKSTMQSLSKVNPKFAELFLTPIDVLNTLLTNDYYAAASEGIFKYYQYLLKQRLS
jgi:hypothetical protein